MIEQLVSELPEIYQPIFGHPEFNEGASRPSADRLEDIAQVHDTLSKLLGRPLKVLDLGCAQGFFSLNLASLGATVHGVDFLDKNVAVCQALAQENPQLHATFEVGRVEQVIQQLTLDQYDLVLGLSVFHHIVHEHGVEFVASLLSKAATNCGVLVTEMALREEPLYWGPSQPDDPRKLLADVAFVHEISRHGTHLGSVVRPLYVASNQFWFLNNVAERFDSWASESHALTRNAYRGSRRYFFGHDSFLKLYWYDGEFSSRNQEELGRDIRFLRNPPKELHAPKILVAGESSTEGWLATERIPGRLLLDIIRDGSVLQHSAIIRDILRQLAILEQHGLYHDDVRTWNVLVDADGSVRLIDYGSISTVAQDCAWPGNLFLSFLIFVHEVSTGAVDDTVMERTVSISPMRLTEPYRSWAQSWWNRPLPEWTFQLLYEKLVDVLTQNRPVVSSLQTGKDLWAKAIEESIQGNKYFSNHTRVLLGQQQDALARLDRTSMEQASQTELLRSELNALNSRQARLEVQAEQLEARSEALQVQSDGHRVRGDAAASERDAILEELRAVRSERDALRQSWSWRVTAPARWCVELMTKPGSAIRSGGNFALSTGINVFQRPLSRAIAAVLRKPELSDRLNHWLLRYPALHRHLVQISQKWGVTSAAQHPHSTNGCVAQSESLTFESLTPRARRIHAALSSGNVHNIELVGETDAHSH